MTAKSLSWRQFIFQQLGVPIRRILRSTNKEGGYAYTLITPSGRAQFKNLAHLISQKTFRIAVAELEGHMPKELSRGFWDLVARGLVAIASEQGIDDSDREVSDDRT